MSSPPPVKRARSSPPPAAKRARLDDATKSKNSGIGNLVASHYNNLDEKGKEHRKESRIFYMRNLNNWIKSQLIDEYMEKIRAKRANMTYEQRREERVNVLDIGCGKGGDLLKWSIARVDHMVCCDIAETSIEQCRDRYQHMGRRRNRGFLFKAEFHTADCTKVRLRNLYKNPNIQFDIVSVQFSFHYCFESQSQAECMLRNISENLKPGGFFIGTTPDAYDIINRLQEAGKAEVKNDVYGIKIEDEQLAHKVLHEPNKIPLFGAKYNFQLEGVVNCPEFLVHFPTFTKLAEKFGLMLVGKRRFGNYFASRLKKGQDLLLRMNALEPYPPMDGVQLVGDENEDYKEAEEYLKNLDEGDQNSARRIGTLSLAEWEAASLYTIFAFKKLS